MTSLWPGAPHNVKAARIVVRGLHQDYLPYQLSFGCYSAQSRILRYSKRQRVGVTYHPRSTVIVRLHCLPTVELVVVVCKYAMVSCTSAVMRTWSHVTPVTPSSPQSQDTTYSWLRVPAQKLFSTWKAHLHLHVLLDGWILDCAK
jgi:hypothetical protein